MRQHKGLIRFSLVAIALLASAGVAWAALTSASFRLYSNSLSGSTAGGTSLGSTSFRMQGTFDGVAVGAQSAGYRLCAGYACQAQTFMVYGPAIQNQNTP
jgi:hypothetical protein